MKKLIVVALMVIGLTTYAQDKRGGERKEMSPEQRTEMTVKKMTKELDLNQTQQKQIKELLDSQKDERAEMIEKRKEIRETAEKATKEQREEMKAKMTAKKEALKSKMKTILTDEQYKKWELNMEMRTEKMKERNAKTKEQNRR